MTETEPLGGAVALVTGASSGIGAATAEHLAGLGATVVLCARRRDRLSSLVERIESRGGRAAAFVADVADEAQARAAVEHAVERFGRLDIAVANAGVMLLGPLADADTGDWRRMIGLNTLGVMYTAHAALPHLLDAAENGPRRIADLVLTSSTAGRLVREGSGAYNASKHAVGAFGEALRREVTRRHVRVALIEPGAVVTELAEHNRPGIRSGIRDRYARMETLRAEDVAESIGFIVTRPRRVAVNEILVRPTEQQE
jgi:NADP-dependent 3-hydroxy acid dehydrogenase YdfG